jgi:hypothetical protein
MKWIGNYTLGVAIVIYHFALLALSERAKQRVIT